MTRSDLGTAVAARLGSAGITPDSVLIEGLEHYLSLLSQWNKRINLTSLPLDSPVPDHSIDRLVVEPVLASRWLRASDRWADFGSGGGSPALPMKLAVPGSHLTMIESRERKCAFLREAVRVLHLTGCEVLQSRFEALPVPLTQLDLVSVRAVRLDEPLLDLMLSALKPGGRLITFGVPVEHGSLQVLAASGEVRVFERTR